VRALRILATVVVSALVLVVGTVIVGTLVTPVADVDAVEFAGKEMQDVQLESRWIQANELRLHVVLAGPPEGEPIVLLHGHPDFWWGWHRQIPDLARAGFRVIAPDLRGFNRSDKPRDVSAYKRVDSINDITRLIDELGYDAAYLVGHDSGAAIGWGLVLRYPERIRGFVSLGVGHPMAYRRPELPLYARILRIPGFVESGALGLVLRSFDWLLLTAGLQASRRNAFDAEELDLYRSSWERDSAITTMFFWTLAENGPLDPAVLSAPIELPVLIVALPDDPAIPVEPARRSTEYCSADVVEVANAGHWFHRESPHQANELIIDFVRRAGGKVGVQPASAADRKRAPLPQSGDEPCPRGKRAFAALEP